MLNTIYSAKYYRAVRYGKIKASTSGNSENVLTARNVRRNETSKKKKNWFVISVLLLYCWNHGFLTKVASDPFVLLEIRLYC